MQQTSFQSASDYLVIWCRWQRNLMQMTRSYDANQKLTCKWLKVSMIFVSIKSLCCSLVTTLPWFNPMMQGMRQNVANHHKLVFPSIRKNINFASKLWLIARMKKNCFWLYSLVYVQSAATGKRYTFAQLGNLFQCRTEIRQHLKTHNHKFIHARMRARADVFWPEFLIFSYGRVGGMLCFIRNI